jgi:hypothetical protein
MGERRLGTVIGLSLLLGACGPLGSSEAQRCAAEAGQQVYSNPQAGYCLAIPETYSVAEFETGAVWIGPNVQVGMEPGLPFLAIEAPEPADGKSAVEAAADFIAFMLGGMEEFEITQAETTLGAEPAVLIDGLPGQDSNRQLIAVHDDLVFRLWLVPATPDYGEQYTEAMALYSHALETFAFEGGGE